MKKKPKVKAAKAWAGCSEGVIDSWEGQEYGYDRKPVLLALFLRRDDAKARYQHVVRVTITESIPTPRRRPKK